MATNRPTPSLSVEAQLSEAIGGFKHDALGFVMFAFPWGQRGTPLEKWDGPETWQKEELERLSKHSRDNAIRIAIGLELVPFRLAVGSGHGVGKSALVAMIICWLMSTRRDMRGAVTATTSEQLESKTWPELGKWHDMLINAHWFGRTATSIYFAQYPEEKRKRYSVMAQTVSAERTEAFAGLHNEGGTILMIFDEASGVHSKVWEVAEGAMTDGEVFFLAFGNPTRAEGEFVDAMTKHAIVPGTGKGLYHVRNVDSRSVRHTNKAALQQIIDKYGEDSDVAKVRVYGMLPSQSFDGFISTDAMQAAIDREVYGDSSAALIMGVDVGRSERGDPSCIRFRQGRDARSIPPVVWHGRDIVAFARVCVDQISKYKPDVICVDATGIGAGLVDTLRSWGHRVVEVHLGVKFESTARWFNKRARLYDLFKSWLYERGAIPDDPELYSQATAIQYRLERDTGRIILEPKEDMRERLGRSPDDLDALILTFEVPEAQRRNHLLNAGVHGRRSELPDYNDFALI